MKFMKGIMVGTLISAGIVMMYMDNNSMNKNKMLKKGKQMVKKLGL